VSYKKNFITMPGLSSASSSTAILAMAGSAALIAGLRYIASASTYRCDREDDDDVDITAEMICDIYARLHMELETIYFDLVTHIQTHLPDWQRRIRNSSDVSKENKCNDEYDIALTPRQITDVVRFELLQRVGTTDCRISQILRNHFPMIRDIESFQDAVQDHLSMGNTEVHQAVASIRRFWEMTRSTRYWNKMIAPSSKHTNKENVTIANAA
jgi:hypothetical protein